MGSMVFTVLAALAQMELEIKRERITDSVAKRRAAGKDLGGRRPTFTDSQIRNALRLIEAGEPAAQVARDLGMSRATLYRRIRELPCRGPSEWCDCCTARGGCGARRFFRGSGSPRS
jgi:DNA invertase Pin-like site-specific DNA recombinase